MIDVIQKKAISLYIILWKFPKLELFSSLEVFLKSLIYDIVPIAYRETWGLNIMVDVENIFKCFDEGRFWLFDSNCIEVCC